MRASASEAHRIAFQRLHQGERGRRRHDLRGKTAIVTGPSAGARPEIGKDGAVSVAGYELPTNGASEMTLNFAGGLEPAELVALINRYLSAMTEIIEKHGGFVDKYVGDAIVAIFGAPAHSPDHAAAAIRAALAAVRL